MNDEFVARYKDLKDLRDFERAFRDIIDDYVDDEGMGDYHLKVDDLNNEEFVVECTSQDGCFNYRRKFGKDRYPDVLFNNFTYKLVIAMKTKDPVQDWTIKDEFKDIIRDYIHNVPDGKCLVMKLKNGEGHHRTFFLHFDVRWPRFSARLNYFNFWNGRGSGVEHEFNVPCLREAVDLEDRWQARFINGRWIPGKSTCLVSWHEYEDDEEYELGKWYIRDTLRLNSEDRDDFFTFGDIESIEIVDMPDPEMYMDSFSEGYMRKMYPEMFEDIPDDPELDEAYEKCQSYNPDAFEYWMDWFCRKRCFIDSGAGCGSNCCKKRVIEFVDYQYDYYKIPSVDGQPNRFTEDEGTEVKE